MVVGSSGYVAVLDVLGFKALVAADYKNDSVIRYLHIIEASLAGSTIPYIVFSDSIVLASHGKEPENLRRMCETCSRLMYDLISAGIAIRGAIACGDFVTSIVNGSAFIAGKPVVEAHEFEQKQNWIGVLLTPSALNAAPIVKVQCTTVFNSDEDLKWKAYVQQCQKIPFHSDTDQRMHDGFAIVPGGSVSLENMVTRLSDVIERLEWLKLLAPTPRDQAKYSATLDWLRRTHGLWESREQERKQ